MIDTNHNFYKKLQNSGNCLLFRDDIGKRKPTTHKLPPVEFSYGKPSHNDEEGAKELISTWKFHRKSPSEGSEQNFKLLNAMSIMNGLSSSKDFKEFRKGKNIGFSEQKVYTNREQSIPDIAHGKPIRQVTPVSDIIKNSYGQIEINKKHDAYAKSPVKKLTKWNSTKNFELLNSFNSKTKQSLQKDYFKMKRFAKIQSKLSTWRIS